MTRHLEKTADVFCVSLVIHILYLKIKKYGVILWVSCEYKYRSVMWLKFPGPKRSSICSWPVFVRFFLKNVLRINTYKIYVIFTLLSFVVHFQLLTFSLYLIDNGYTNLTCTSNDERGNNVCL